MAQQTIVGYFNTRAEAQAARDDLTREGFSSSSIKILPEGNADYTRSSTDTGYDHRRDEGGFWASLRDLFLPEEDRYTYAEGMSRGGVTLSLNADEADYTRAVDILERNGSADVDELETEWKSAGWQGYSADASAFNAPADRPAAGLASVSTATGSVATGSTTTGGAGYATAATGSDYAARSTDGDEVIPVIEEQLRVGKRQVDKGRVRIRSYVVESPVQEQVSLHSERVVLERRPVDRVLSGTEAAFTDRVIEAEEHAEEAVVSKEARVKEEITLRRQAEDRTETVSDTVRRTEVEIEDERAEANQLEAERARTNKPSSI